MKVSVVDIPDAGKSIDYVVSNRSPLLPSRFAKLPLGSVRPKGWLRHQLDLMTDGVTGRIEEISPFVPNEGWFGTPIKDAWEAQPYWLRGFYDLGILTGDERIVRKAERWIEGTISTRQPDGYFGPPNLKAFKSESGGVGFEIWPHMVMIDALRSHYEATGDERIVPMLLDFFRFCAQIPEEWFFSPKVPEYGQWQVVRAGDMLPHIYWLYDITGEDWLLGVAKRFHDHVSKPQGMSLAEHVVNFTQRFREPGNFYIQSHDPKHLKETEYWYDMHMAEWGQQPGGAFGSDECIREGKTDAKQGIETCGIVEFCKSFYILGQITGQALYADRVEDLIFNTFPASMSPDLKGLHYVTAANQPQLDRTDQHDHCNVVRLLDYSAYPYFCCAHNLAMGWPYYAEHLWMAAPGNGLVAWLYGECEVTAKVGDGKVITIREETDYPFKTSVKMTVELDGEADFPLYLRVPGWCKNSSIRVNGEPFDTAFEPGTYVIIERTWKNGDEVEIEMPVELSVRVWEKQGRAVTVDRGPLSYSLKIGEDWRLEPDSRDPVNWPEWEVYPTTPWNYGLVYDPNDLKSSFEVIGKGRKDDQPWTIDAAPIEIKAKGKRIPNWVMIGEHVTDLQPSPVSSDEPEEEITLIPMGCARLRMSVLPVIGGPDARRWKRVSSHEEAMKIRLDED